MRNALNNLVIKRKIVLWGELIVIALGPLFIFAAWSIRDDSSYTDVIIIYFIFACLVTVFSLYVLQQLIKELLTRDVRIIIDERGIEDCEKDKLLAWDVIKYAYVRRRRSRRGNRTTYYLTIIKNDGEVKIDITDFAYSTSKIKEAVEGFSGRDIGDYSDQVRDTLKGELMGVLDGKNNSEEITGTMMAFTRKHRQIKVLVFLTIIAIAIFLQAMEVATFVLLLGFIISWYASKFVGSQLEKNFRKKELIAQLNEETYSKMAITTGVKKEKGEINAYRFLFWILAILICIISIFFF
jgi:hypothetical protein